MSRPNNFNEISNDASPLRMFEKSLQMVALNGKHKKEADFAEAYSMIEQHLACKVSQKVLLENFNAAYGHTLHPPGFRKLLEQERKLRKECGGAAACHACGKPLDIPNEVAHGLDASGNEGAES